MKSLKAFLKAAKVLEGLNKNETKKRMNVIRYRKIMYKVFIFHLPELISCLLLVIVVYFCMEVCCLSNIF